MVVLEVVVLVVVEVVVLEVVVLAQPPCGGFQTKPPSPNPAVNMHSPWHTGLGDMSGGCVEVVEDDEATSWGRSFVQYPFLCLKTCTKSVVVRA